MMTRRLKNLMLLALWLLSARLGYATEEGRSSFPLFLTPPTSFAPHTALSPLERSVSQLQERLVALAESFVELRHVPYIWGGGQIGQNRDCVSCRACVQSKAIPLTDRLQACDACKRCGIDCSHFVTLLFRRAGLDYAYASSLELGGHSKSKLLEMYGLIDIGTDLSLSQPGDILVYPRHVGVLTKLIDQEHGDMVHATRYRRGDRLQLGGINIDRNMKLTNQRGKLKRILRHHRLFENRRNFSSRSQRFSANIS